MYKALVHLPPSLDGWDIYFLLTTGNLNYKGLFFASLVGVVQESHSGLCFKYNFGMKHKPGMIRTYLG